MPLRKLSIPEFGYGFRDESSFTQKLASQDYVIKETLQELRCSNMKISFVRFLPQLRVLELTTYYDIDVTLISDLYLKKLQSLTLASQGLIVRGEDSPFKSVEDCLSSLVELRKLDVVNHNFHTLKFLENLPELQYLDVPFKRGDIRNIWHPDDFKNLMKAEMSYIGGDNLPRLRHLSTTRWCGEISSKVEFWDIFFQQVLQGANSSSKRVVGLEELIMYHTIFSPRAISALHHHQQTSSSNNSCSSPLRKLHVDHAELVFTPGCDFCILISKLPNLEDLKLLRCSLRSTTSARTSPISSSSSAFPWKKLRKLDLRFCTEVSPTLIVRDLISRFENLEELNLTDCVGSHDESLFQHLTPLLEEGNLKKLHCCRCTTMMDWRIEREFLKGRKNSPFGNLQDLALTLLDDDYTTNSEMEKESFAVISASFPLLRRLQLTKPSSFFTVKNVVEELTRLKNLDVLELVGGRQQSDQADVELKTSLIKSAFHKSTIVHCS